MVRNQLSHLLVCSSTSSPPSRLLYCGTTTAPTMGTAWLLVFLGTYSGSFSSSSSISATARFLPFRFVLGTSFSTISSLPIFLVLRFDLVASTTSCSTTFFLPLRGWETFCSLSPSMATSLSFFGLGAPCCRSMLLAFFVVAPCGFGFGGSASTSSSLNLFGMGDPTSLPLLSTSFFASSVGVLVTTSSAAAGCALAGSSGLAEAPGPLFGIATYSPQSRFEAPLPHGQPRLTSVRCEYLSCTSAVYSHPCIHTVRSFTQYNLSSIRQYHAKAHCSLTATASVEKYLL
jgi:hypothetical protein